MSNYDDKEECLIDAKDDVRDGLQDLHPTDKAVVYRAVEAWAGKRATEQEADNERDGVPER